MNKHEKVRTTLEYAAARAIIGTLGALPYPIAVAAGRGIGHIAYLLAGRLRRVGEINLRLAFPESDARERTRILRGCFDSLGRLLGVFSQFPRATVERLRQISEYDGLEHILAATARGKGVILMTSHTGAWELSSFAHSAFGYPHTFLVRRIDNPRVEQLVDDIRTRFGNQSLDKKAAARKAIRILRAGGTLGVLADLNTHPHEGAFVPFFNHLACTTTGVAALALRTDAAVIPVHTTWESTRKRFVIHIEPPVELIRTGNFESDVIANTTHFAVIIERHIRAYPDQWLWVHKRWQTRPAGEPNLYQLSSLQRRSSSRSARTSKDKVFHLKS